MVKKILSVVVVAFIFSVLSIRSAKALTLIPPSFEFQVKPGGTIETKVKLFNEEQVEKQFYTDTASFTASGETGNPTYDFTVPVEGLSSWFVVEKGPITLKPGDRVEIPVTINVPADAEPGGHYAVLAFSTTPPDTEGTQQIGVSASLGTLFLVRVEGEVVESGTIKEFGLLSASTTLTRLPANFFVRYENAGNIHLRPSGKITISNLFHKVSGIVDVNPAKGATLPGTVRKYDPVWERATVAEASGSVWQVFWQEFGNERKNFALGKYTALAELTAGSTDQIKDSAEVAFWVLPWHLGVVYGVGLIVLVIILWLLIKKYNTWIIGRAGNKSEKEKEKKSNEQSETKGTDV